MTTARLRTATREVWQYNTGAIQYDAGENPAWVVRCTEWHDDGLYLVRRSGKQRVEPGDWLLRDLDDRDPEWMDDVDFQQIYELVSTPRTPPD